MEKILRKFVIFFAALLLGYLISISFNFNYNSIAVTVHLDTSAYKKAQVQKNNLLKQVISLKTQNEEYQTKIDNYTLDDKNNERVINDLSSQLNDYGLVSGSKAVCGPGIKITIDDGLVSSFDTEYQAKAKLLHDFDMENILNALRISGAEAISINTHRISAMTSIQCHQAFLQFEDGTLEHAPFTIYAIGNPDKLNKSLHQDSSYLNILQTRGLSIDFETQDRITMSATAPKYLQFVQPYSK